MMFKNVWWVRTATRAAPCKRTAQHLEIGSYITSEIGIGSYIRDRELKVTSEIRNWKSHQI